MDEPQHWVRIQRRLVANGLWSDIHGSRLFLWLILAAEWREGPQRGSVWATRASLAAANHCTPAEVTTALRRLRREKRITTTPEGRGMRIAVTNYDRYQRWKRDPAQASRGRSKAKRPPVEVAAKPQTRGQVEAATPAPAVLAIPAEIVREPWHLGRKDWAEVAAKPVRSLPLDSTDAGHPLEWLRLDTWVADTEGRFVRWFRRQLSHSTPVYRATQTDLLYCLAAAWASKGVAEADRISRFVALSAEQTVSNWRAIGRHVNSLVPHLDSILTKSEAHR
jgi:hypothetical protein